MAGDWDDAGLVQADDLDQLVHAARLLGADGSLALGGVGAASVKGTVTDVTGEPVDVLWVTGRDADLAATGRAGLAPLRLERLTVLAGLTALDDDRLAAELRAASLDPGAPTPSPAAVLHAVLPYRYVLQTPAAAVLALTATPGGADLVAEVYGDEVVVVPHAEDGLALARLRRREGARRRRRASGSLGAGSAG
nr:bifunctional aldolase/short-chain dehydrogenase [Thermoanaerobacterales bacterium]